MNCKKLHSASSKGFTLIELIIVMGLFIVVLVIAAQAFNLIISSTSKIVKSEESNIEGVIGLEMFRHDLEQAGFGLPWGWCVRSVASGDLVDAQIKYSEAVDATGALLNDGKNSATSGDVPRALVGLAGKGAFGSDYIALKGTTVGRDLTSQRWSYVPFHNISTSSGRVSQPITATFNNPLQAGDQVVAMNMNFNNTDKDHKLLVDPAGPQYFTINFSISSISDNYLPVSDQDTVMLYGVSGDRMPFNRADYFISTTATPAFCAENTGVLYKATVNHANGAYNYLPLIDCVADMKVVIGWDSSEGLTGGAAVYSTLPKTAGSTPDYIVGADPGVAAYFGSAQSVRERVKLIKIYILAQDGKRDSQYQAPASMVVGASLGESGNLPSSANTYTFTTAQRQYHWRLYRIVVQPKNLVSNQK